jgi:tRNA 2-thiouridine synthesizing protein E
MRTRPDKLGEIIVDDKRVAVDEQGFLVDPDEWNERVAETMAQALGVELTDEHWAVVRFMRRFLDEHGVAADARFVFQFVADKTGGSQAAGRNRFFDLFPYGYVGQACKIAGMRQPRAWSTG